MTPTSRIVALTLIALAGLLASSRPSSAEWFADVYAGASVTRDADVTVHDAVVGQGVYRDLEFATTQAYGARLGHYFDGLPFVGLAADVFSFSPNIRPQLAQRDGCFLVTGCGSGQSRTGRIDIDAYAASLDLMLRLPLFKTAEEPHGVLQPYLAVGAPLFFTRVTPRSTRQFRNQDDDFDISVGYKGAVGVAFRILSNLDLIGEYRYTHTSTSVDLRDAVNRNASFDTELNTHTFLLGLSARW